LTKELRLAQQTQTSIKCRLTDVVMGDRDPPMWVPVYVGEGPTDADKDEAKRNSQFAAELKM
jgi:hypothetical protein